jgi:hypothetical protein
MVNLTKKQILETDNWLETNYENDMESFYWKDKNINNEHKFHMKRYRSDGLTFIYEEGYVKNKLFEGYITCLYDLKLMERLLKLTEIKILC